MRVALVTAASKGIGAACARELRARGYELALLARGEEVNVVARELGAIAVQGSVAEPAPLVEAAMAKWGRIDAVVANTGHPAKGEPLALDDAAWQDGYELILASAIRLARLVTPVMEKQRGGAFVHVSSYAAARPDVTRPVSTVFRAALGAWVKVHAEAVAKHGVRVNAVLPGFVDSYPVGAEIVAGIPMGRPGTVGELAKVVAFLASDEASYVTGQCLLVDGGMV